MTAKHWFGGVWRSLTDMTPAPARVQGHVMPPARDYAGILSAPGFTPAQAEGALRRKAEKQKRIIAGNIKIVSKSVGYTAWVETDRWI